MEEQIQKELAYVKRVMHSCTTYDQKKNALRWAKGWANRQKHKFSKNPSKWIELYFSVIK
jgi:hypothetical protein